ncbi:MAG: hypothetical protein HRU70_01175 [Phycisphaeraceae bacterium]|nr:MAG: hypothetical protein HRU70_01175 [Phycisphaeraceae bacterium]
MKFTPAPTAVAAAAAALALALTAAAYLAVVGPTHAALERRGHLQGLLDQAEEQRRTVEADARDYERRATDAERRAAEHPYLAIPAPGLNERLARLTTLADESACRVLEMFSPPKHDPAAPAVITIKGSATFPAWSAFIEAVAREFPDLAPTRLSLIGNAEDPAIGVAAWIDLAWYAAGNDHAAPAAK